MGETKGGVRSEDGGLRYEVVLEEAKTKKMPRPKSAPAPRKYENVEEKLKVNKYNKSHPEKNVKLDNHQPLYRRLRRGGRRWRGASWRVWPTGTGGQTRSGPRRSP